MSDYLLADDLSGALEVGATLRSQGCPISVSLHPSTSGSGVEVISTETRNAAPAKAGHIVGDVLQRQSLAGHCLRFKKVDSTLRGPIAAELDAVLKTLQPPLVIFCPANPATGRTVSDGKLFVNGTPLADTAFRADPIWPMRTSLVADIIGQLSTRLVSLSCSQLRLGTGISEVLSARNCVIVCDAETEADLDRLVTECHSHSANPVWVGANGLVAALTRAGGISVRRSATAKSIFNPSEFVHRNPCLIVCGSRHPNSHRQIDYFANATGKPVHTATLRDFDTGSLTRALRHTLTVNDVAAFRFAPNEEASPFEVVAALESLFSLFSKATPFASLFLTGGDTAWTVCRALGGQNLRVCGELENGVVVSRLERTNKLRSLDILTKPGGYGDEAALARIYSERRSNG